MIACVRHIIFRDEILFVAVGRQFIGTLPARILKLFIVVSHLKQVLLVVLDPVVINAK